MHSVTSRQILEPIAEAVSQLILINAEAEIRNAALPDLSEAAKAVDLQVQQLVNVGKALAEDAKADKQLADDMDQASGTGMIRYIIN